jgi:hypothetical protein
VPAWTRPTKTSSSQLAGPTVAMIFVRLPYIRHMTVEAA